MTYKFVTTPIRSKIMKNIKGSETKSEIFFRKILWSQGIRYRKNNNKILGKPDVSIKKYKIAIFIDGEFWHGYDWKKKKEKIKTNRNYWIPKIEKNIERDKINNFILKKEGWSVFRFWESEIKTKPQKCVKKVLMSIKEKER